MEEKILQDNCPLSAMWCKIVIYAISIGIGMEYLTSMISIDEDTYKQIVENIESSYWNFLNKKRIIEYSVYFLPKWAGPVICKIGELTMLYCLMKSSNNVSKPLSYSLLFLIIIIGISAYSIYVTNGIIKFDINYMIQMGLYVCIGVNLCCLHSGKIRTLGLAFIIYPILLSLFSYTSINHPIIVDNSFNINLLLKALLIPFFYDYIRKTIAPS